MSAQSLNKDYGKEFSTCGESDNRKDNYCTSNISCDNIHSDALDKSSCFNGLMGYLRSNSHRKDICVENSENIVGGVTMKLSKTHKQESCLEKNSDFPDFVIRPSSDAMARYFNANAGNEVFVTENELKEENINKKRKILSESNISSSDYTEIPPLFNFPVKSFSKYMYSDICLSTLSFRTYAKQLLHQVYSDCAH